MGGREMAVCGEPSDRWVRAGRMHLDIFRARNGSWASQKETRCQPSKTAGPHCP
jgi:hypothetical protein